MSREISRKNRDSNTVYRVLINHLLADGSAAYMTRFYGPYLSLTVAKSQETRLVAEATRDGKKASSGIDKSVLDWNPA